MKKGGGNKLFLTRSLYVLEDATSRRKENFTAMFTSEVSYVLYDGPSRKVGWRPGKSLVREQGSGVPRGRFGVFNPPPKF